MMKRILRAAKDARKYEGGVAALRSALSNVPCPEVAKVSKPSTNWLFLGPPGVGKGTYASRVAGVLGFQHLSTGDLIRSEIKTQSDLGKQMSSIIAKGHLLPDDMMMQVVQQKLAAGHPQGEHGYIFDGFPRTRNQAEMLMDLTELHLALNMSLREEVLVEKLMGRRICKKCGKNYNVANIYLPKEDTRPEIIMPPMDPPRGCEHLMEQRVDDKEDIILERLKIHHTEAKPVEDYFREHNLVEDFEITAGIPDTLPRLLKVLKPYMAGPEADVMTG